MLVVLPPSEGKTAPSTGRPVSLESLTFPTLSESRHEVLDALAEFSTRDGAAAALGVPSTLADLVRDHVNLPHAPAAPARQVYTGVLFAAADFAALPERGQRRARKDVLIMSGLYGVVSPSDRIAAYRLSMDAELPELGRLNRWWRPRLSPLLDARAAGDVVVDCRSAAYRQAWTPVTAADHVVVEAVTVRDGRRATVSHNAKLFRGALTRHLLIRQGRAPRSATSLYEAARELIGTAVTQLRGSDIVIGDVEFRPGSSNAPDSLTLVLE